MRIKHALVAAGIAAATLFTAGCMSMTADITLNDQAKGSGTLTISVNKQVASLAGIGSADAFKAQLTENDTDLPSNASVETKESDTDYIATVTFKDTELDDEEFGAEVLDNGNVKFTFVNEGSEATSEDDMFADMDMGNVNLTINFPGEVVEFSGEGATKVDEDTVKWSFPLTASTTATATSLVAASSFPFLPLGLGVFALAVAGGAVLFAVRRRKPTAVLEPTSDSNVDESGVVEDPTGGPSS